VTSRGYQAADFGARSLHDSEKMEENLAHFRTDKAIVYFLETNEMYQCRQNLQTNRNPVNEHSVWCILFLASD